MATSLLFVALIGAGWVGVLWLGLGVMVTDVCAYQDCPHEYRAEWGMKGGWAGIALTVISAGVLAARASGRGRAMWIYPALGLLGVVAVWFAGIQVMATSIN